MTTASRVERHPRRRPLLSAVPAGGAGGSWQQGAACAHENPELFFPVGTTGLAFVQIQEAKAVCQGCPVMADCLAWSLEAGVEHGVWGGRSEEERRTLRRRRSRSRSGRSA